MVQRLILDICDGIVVVNVLNLLFNVLVRVLLAGEFLDALILGEALLVVCSKCFVRCPCAPVHRREIGRGNVDPVEAVGVCLPRVLVVDVLLCRPRKRMASVFVLLYY